MKKTISFRGKNRKVLQHIMNTIIPHGGPFELGAPDFDLAGMANDYLRVYSRENRMFFILMIYYIQYTSLFRYGKTFTKLDGARAAQFLGRMEHSRFYYKRSIVLLLKTLTFLSFYNIKEAEEQIGYFHGCHLEPAGTHIKEAVNL